MVRDSIAFEVSEVGSLVGLHVLQYMDLQVDGAFMYSRTSQTTCELTEPRRNGNRQ